MRDGQRPHREGRLVGRPHGREDRAAHRVRAAPRAAGLLAGRLGRGPHHRSGRAVPGPPRRRAHLRQPGAAVGQGAPGVLPVRPVGGRRRLHPELLRRRRSWSRATRRCTSGSPRMAEEVIGEQVTLEEMGGARMHATRVGLRRQPRRRRRRRHRAGQAAGSRTCPATGASRRRRTIGRAAGATAAPRRPPRRRRRRATTCTASSTALVDADSLLRGEAAVGARADRRLRPPRRPPDRHRGQQPDAEGRRAVRRLGRQGGPLHLAVRRLQHPAACSWPTCPAS